MSRRDPKSTDRPGADAPEAEQPAPSGEETHEDQADGFVETRDDEPDLTP